MISLKLGKIALAAAVMPALLAQTAFSAAAAKSARAPQAAERVAEKCKKSDDLVKRRKGCTPLARAEPAVAKKNGFFPLPMAALLAQTTAASLAVASNSKNCGKGNNSGTGTGNGGQNNGNCPASP